MNVATVDGGRALAGRASPAGGEYTFVNCLVEPWHSPWLAHQPVMALLARGNNVFYNLDEPTFHQVKADLFAPRLPESGLERIGERIVQWRPSKLFPRFHSSLRLNRWSSRLRQWELRRQLDRMGWDNRVLSVWHPRFKGFIGRIGERISVFHCHDYFPHFYRTDDPRRESAAREFDEVVDMAGLVFASTQAVYEKVRERRTRGVHLVENGVNAALFHAVARARDVAEPMRGMTRPVVGYIGRINCKVNVEVLLDIARRRPGWSVVLMGPRVGWEADQEETFARFRSLPNAFFLEGTSPEELPRYMNGLDVGLMNYNVGDLWVAYGFPLKMFEYFGVGKPALCVDLVSVRKYSPPLTIVKHGEDWVDAIEAALAADSPELRRRRMELAAENSWERRCVDILRYLGEALAGDGTPEATD